MTAQLELHLGDTRPPAPLQPSPRCRFWLGATSNFRDPHAELAELERMRTAPRVTTDDWPTGRAS